MRNTGEYLLLLGTIAGGLAAPVVANQCKFGYEKYEVYAQQGSTIAYQGVRAEFVADASCITGPAEQIWRRIRDVYNLPE
jgi:hypothetical protein